MSSSHEVPAPKKTSPETQIKIDPRKIRFADDEINSDHFFRNARVKLNKQDMMSLRSHIQQHGLLQALTVRPYRMPNKEGYSHELVLGSRRLRCILGFLEHDTEVYDKQTGSFRSASEVYNPENFIVNCRDCDDEEAISLSLGENIEREQLDELDLMDFCKELSELKESTNEDKFSREQIARICNRSTSWVSLTLKLNDLPSDIKEMMAQRRVTRTAALSLLQTNYEKMKEVMGTAIGLMRQEAKKDEQEALSEYSEAISDVEQAENDAAMAALLNNQSGLISANKRLRRSKKRVRTASEKRKEAKDKSTGGQITADHINQANLIVPGAKKGKPKPLPVRLIRERLGEYEPDDDLVAKGICGALEWVLGRRHAENITNLLDQLKSSEG